MIITIENNKVKVLKLYSEIRIVDAELSYGKCILFLSNINVYQDKDEDDEDDDIDYEF